jgi:hypothetical protein
VNNVDVLGLFETQVQVDEVRMTVLLGMLSRDPSKLPTEFPQELANMNYLPNAEKFGLLKPFGTEDYQRAFSYVQSAGQPSMRTMGWEEAEAANRPSFRNQEWIPHLTRSQNLGAANTPLLAQINSDFLLPTGGAAMGLKFALGGLKTALPVLAAGARMEGRLLTTEFQMGRMTQEFAASKTVYHTVTSPSHAHGILKGIDPAFLNPNSRFGKAFYTSDDAGTTLWELFHHNAPSTHTLRFDLNISKAKILDLGDPAIAKAWGYTGGPISDATKAIGPRAISAGFNVIKVPSLRGPGTNFGILTNFDDLLIPKGIVPAVPTP